MEKKKGFESLSEEDKEFVRAKVKPKFPDMEVHLEIFDLPSGKELYVYCDGRCVVKD